MSTGARLCKNRQRCVNKHVQNVVFSPSLFILLLIPFCINGRQTVTYGGNSCYLAV